MATSAEVAAGDVVQATDYNNLRTDVRATHDHEGTEGQKINATNAIDAGVLAHERGGLEFDVSAITTGGVAAGASAGVMQINTLGTQSQAEAGTETVGRLWAAAQLKQAIAALESGSDLFTHFIYGS